MSILTIACFGSSQMQGADINPPYTVADARVKLWNGGGGTWDYLVDPTAGAGASCLPAMGNRILALSDANGLGITEVRFIQGGQSGIGVLKPDVDHWSDNTQAAWTAIASQITNSGGTIDVAMYMGSHKDIADGVTTAAHTAAYTTFVTNIRSAYGTGVMVLSSIPYRTDVWYKPIANSFEELLSLNSFYLATNEALYSRIDAIHLDKTSQNSAGVDFANEYIYRAHNIGGPTMGLIIFANKTGGEATGHKDTWVVAGNDDSAWGSGENMFTRGGGATDRWILMRFNVESALLPEDGSKTLLQAVQDGTVIIDSVILRIALKANANAATISFYTVNSTWGVSNVDEGAIEHPATGLKPTWRRRFDNNGGGGDVTWSAGNISAADYSTLIATTALAGTELADSFVSWDFTTYINNILNGTITNNGVVGLNSVGNNTNEWWSQEGVVAEALRWDLTVNYTVVPALGQTGEGFEKLDMTHALGF